MVNIGKLERDEVTVDVARVLYPPDIRCHWHRKIDTTTGEFRWVIWAVDYAKDRRPVLGKRRAHTIIVGGHRLVCDCDSYYWSKPGQKTCKHIVGAAKWLEDLASSVVGDEGKIAFCLGCHNDPHRLAARRERQQVAIADLEQRQGRPATLEQLFDVE